MATIVLWPGDANIGPRHWAEYPPFPLEGSAGRQQDEESSWERRIHIRLANWPEG